MDEDDTDLARQLCTRAGMIMEDTSATAILIGDEDSNDLRLIIADMEHQSNRFNALLAAAKVLLSKSASA